MTGSVAASNALQATSMTSGFTTSVDFSDANTITSSGIGYHATIPTAVGSTTSGEIWAIYELPSSSKTYYAQELGKATMKIS